MCYIEIVIFQNLTIKERRRCKTSACEYRIRTECLLLTHCEETTLLIIRL